MTCACGANLTFEDAQLGQSGPCYQCGQTLTVAPTAASPMAAPAAPIGQAPHAQPPQPQFGGPGQAPGAFGGAPPSGPSGGPSGSYGMPAPSVSTTGDSQSKEGWSWRYSPLVGVMYGPIPVGIIVVVICGMIYMATQL